MPSNMISANENSGQMTTSLPNNVTLVHELLSWQSLYLITSPCRHRHTRMTDKWLIRGENVCREEVRHLVTLWVWVSLMDTAYIKVNDNKPRDLRCRPSIGKHVNNNNKIKTKINFNPLETTGMDALTEVLCKLKELCVCFVGVVVVFVVFMCMLLFDCCVVVAFFPLLFLIVWKISPSTDRRRVVKRVVMIVLMIPLF